MKKYDIMRVDEINSSDNSNNLLRLLATMGIPEYRRLMISSREFPFCVPRKEALGYE